MQLNEVQKFFESSCRVLLMDGTYKLNDLDMPVYIFMASDALGSRWIVAAAILPSETSDEIGDAIKKLKTLNP